MEVARQYGYFESRDVHFTYWNLFMLALLIVCITIASYTD